MAEYLEFVGNMSPVPGIINTPFIHELLLDSLPPLSHTMQHIALHKDCLLYKLNTIFVPLLAGEAYTEKKHGMCCVVYTA